MHFEFKDLSGHKFKLLGLNISFYSWVRCKIIMLFVHVLFCCIKSIFVCVFVLSIIKGFFKILCLFFKRLKLTSSNHCINMSNISEWIAWKTIYHFGIRKDWLTDSNGIVRVSKLNLSMGENTSYTDGTWLCSLPMPTKCGFIFLIEQWVHYWGNSISYNIYYKQCKL